MSTNTNRNHVISPAPPMGGPKIREFDLPTQPAPERIGRGAVLFFSFGTAVYMAFRPLIVLVPLTLLFIVLHLLGVNHWSWWVLVIPLGVRFLWNLGWNLLITPLMRPEDFR